MGIFFGDLDMCIEHHAFPCVLYLGSLGSAKKLFELLVVVHCLFESLCGLVLLVDLFPRAVRMFLAR